MFGAPCRMISVWPCGFSCTESPTAPCCSPCPAPGWSPPGLPAPCSLPCLPVDLPAPVDAGDVPVLADAVLGGALATPAGSPTVAVSLPCGIASGARLTSLAASAALVAAWFRVGTVASAPAGVLAGFGALAALGVGAGTARFAIVVGALRDGRRADGWMAGARVTWLRSILAGGTGADGGDTGATVAGTACSSVAPTVTAGACGSGSAFGAITTGAGTAGCCITLTGATVFGTSTCMAMVGRLSGAGADTFGNANEVGDRSGRLPSACGGR